MIATKRTISVTTEHTDTVIREEQSARNTSPSLLEMHTISTKWNVQENLVSEHNKSPIEDEQGICTKITADFLLYKIDRRTYRKARREFYKLHACFPKLKVENRKIEGSRKRLHRNKKHKFTSIAYYAVS